MEDVLVEPLYETQTVCTWEEYQNYNKTVFKILNRKNFLIGYGAFGGIIVIWLALVFPTMNELYTVLRFLFFLLVFPISLFAFKVSIASGGKKQYDSDKIMQNATVYFNFWDDSIESINPKGTEKTPYLNLYKIIETQTNFYLMVSINSGYIIVKENCSSKLQVFLSEIAEQVNKKK